MSLYSETARTRWCEPIKQKTPGTVCAGVSYTLTFCANGMREEIRLKLAQALPDAPQLRDGRPVVNEDAEAVFKFPEGV